MTINIRPTAAWPLRAILFAALAFCFASPAGAVVITAEKDTTIFQNNVNNSAGGQTQFYVGTNTAISPRRGLLEFNIASAVPAGATITSVSLQLSLSMVAGSGMGMGGGSPTIGLHEASKEWGEGTVSTGQGQGNTANSGDATWTAPMNGGAAWSTVGGGGDYDGTASASLTIVGTTIGTAYTWASTPALVADVQGWLNSPSSNHGWLLLNADELTAQTFRAFNSREIALTDSSKQPILTVLYTIPEPSSLVLFAAGAALAFVRGRRKWLA